MILGYLRALLADLGQRIAAAFPPVIPAPIESRGDPYPGRSHRWHNQPSPPPGLTWQQARLSAAADIANGYLTLAEAAALYGVNPRTQWEYRRVVTYCPDLAGQVWRETLPIGAAIREARYRATGVMPPPRPKRAIASAWTSLPPLVSRAGHVIRP